MHNNKKVYPVIASETKQSYALRLTSTLWRGDCFGAPLLAMTNYIALLYTSVLIPYNAVKLYVTARLIRR